MRWERAWAPGRGEYISVHKALSVRSETGEFREGTCYHNREYFEAGYGVSLFPNREGINGKSAHFARYGHERNSRAMQKIAEITGMESTNNAKYLDSAMRVSTLLSNIGIALSEGLAIELGMDSYEQKRKSSPRDFDLPDFTFKFPPEDEEKEHNEVNLFIKEKGRIIKKEGLDCHDLVLDITKWETSVIENRSKSKELFMAHWKAFQNRKKSEESRKNFEKRKFSDLVSQLQDALESADFDLALTCIQALIKIDGNDKVNRDYLGFKNLLSHSKVDREMLAGMDERLARAIITLDKLRIEGVMMKLGSLESSLGKQELDPSIRYHYELQAQVEVFFGLTTDEMEKLFLGEYEGKHQNLAKMKYRFFRVRSDLLELKDRGGDSLIWNRIRRRDDILRERNRSQSKSTESTDRPETEGRKSPTEWKPRAVQKRRRPRRGPKDIFSLNLEPSESDESDDRNV